MGEEEKNRKQKEDQKKQGAGPQPSHLDHLVASYDPHGSYSGHILKPSAHRENVCIVYIYIIIIIWRVCRSRQHSRFYITAEDKDVLKIRHKA